jgi:hypothetical protein
LKTNYILIDFENVQPDNLSLLSGHGVRLIVFLGATQKSVPVPFAVAMQALGDKAQYLEITGNGRNALDFHVAFYMGELAAGDETAFFNVISRDKGFDPLLTHLRKRKINAWRQEDISQIPFVKAALATSLGERVDLTSERLRSRGAARPSKVSTLTAVLNRIFFSKLDAPALDAIIAEMQRRKHIAITDQKVSYGPAITGA